MPGVLRGGLISADEEWPQPARSGRAHASVRSAGDLGEAADAFVGVDVQKDPSVARAWQVRGGDVGDLHPSFRTSNVETARDSASQTQKLPCQMVMPCGSGPLQPTALRMSPVNGLSL